MSDQNQFGFNLLNRLGFGNVFISPFSLASLFAPLYDLDCFEKSKTGYIGQIPNLGPEIANTFHFDGQDSVRDQFIKIPDELNKLNDTIKLEISNSSWLQTGYPYSKSFLQTVAGYKYCLFSSDFISNPEKERILINAFTEEKTHSLIKELLSPGALDEKTRFVLLNTIYFRGNWLLPFDTGLRPLPFKTPNSLKYVKSMYTNRRFNYVDSPDCRAIEIPYKDQRLSMFIFVPKTYGSKSVLEISNNYEQLINKMEMKDVYLNLPKFSFGAKIENLLGIFAGMGMPSILPPAVWPNLEVLVDRTQPSSFTEPLEINKIVHESIIKVYEQGTEAAAASAICGYSGSSKEEPISVIIDTSFIFMIRDNSSKTILFLGRCENPEINFEDPV